MEKQDFVQRGTKKTTSQAYAKAYPAIQCGQVRRPIPRRALFANQKSQTELFVRTMGITQNHQDLPVEPKIKT